jgi:hypothetical protein
MRLLDRRDKAEAKRREKQALEHRELKYAEEALQRDHDRAARAQELRNGRWINRASWGAVLVALVAVLLAMWGQWSTSKDMADAVAQITELTAASRDQASSSSTIASASAEQMRAAAEQVRTSQEIAKASTRQAEAAQDAIRINRESLRIASREMVRAEAAERERQIPRLEPISIKLVRLERGDRPVVDVELVNNGTSPALEVGFLTKFSTYPESDVEELGEYRPFGTVDRRATFQLGDGMPQSQLTSSTPTAELRFEATIDFQDFMGRSYTQKLCARMAGPIEIGQEFRPCSKGGFTLLPPCCQNRTGGGEPDRAPSQPNLVPSNTKRRSSNP